MLCDEFAVFILTHGRAKNVITAKTLHELGYTGKYYIVIDDEDDQEDEYRRIYGNKVIQFCKKDIAETFDTMDLSNDRRTIVYARNACFQIAKSLGIRYFLELDDDYTDFQYRWISGGRLLIEQAKDLDGLFSAMVEFLKDTKADTVALSQGGDFIGGAGNSRLQQELLRKAMNSFFCDSEKPFKFIGRINEDVNTYTRLGSTGWLALTITKCMLTQKQTQANKGGMSDVYLDSGTYLKSFYTVMVMPSAVKICEMGDTNRRIHHSVSWEHCVPKILNERWKKKA
jgi:hypothetical protein